MAHKAEYQRSIDTSSTLQFLRRYSRTPLMWTPWGPGEVSCIERCPHFRGKFLLRKHIGDIESVHNTEVSLFLGCPLRGVPLYIS